MPLREALVNTLIHADFSGRASKQSLGNETFSQLTDHERLVLITASIETTVDHSRMMSILDIHPRDLTTLFSGLVDKGLIERDGSGRGSVYFLPDARDRDLWRENGGEQTSTPKGPESRSGPLGERSGPLEDSSGPLGERSGPLEDSSGPLAELKDLARPIAQRKKAPRSDAEAVILALCERQPLRPEQLEQLLNRSADSLRKRYLQPLVKARKLQLKYPTKPNHPQQAYMRGDVTP